MQLENFLFEKKMSCFFSIWQKR